MAVHLDKNAKRKSYYFQKMVDGKRVTRRGFATKGEARAAEAEIINDLTKGNYIEPSKLTFGEYFNNWLQNRTTIAGTTRKMYESYFKIHINPALGKIPLAKLSPMEVQKFVKGLVDKGLSQEMVKRIYSTINTSLNNAAKMELIKKNVADLIEKPRVKREERKVWNVETVKQFLNHTKDKSRYWIAFYLAVKTGMRQGEILGLQWSDIDLAKKVITVRRNLRKDTATFDDLKTEKSRRTISISQRDVDELLLQQEKINLEKLGANYQDMNLVVPSSKGTVARATKVVKSWQSLQQQYKPKDEPFITFHDLRHQHASLLLSKNVHIKVVSERLGHSNVNITLNTYSHLLPNMQEDAVNKLEDLME